MTEIVVIDAGVGNLGNLKRAVERVGAPARITDDPDVVAASRRLILPGVGAFRPPRERMRGGLEAALRHSLDDGGWLLGICIGFQLLFEASTEFGTTDGLGLLGGRVTPLPPGVELPHMGWNRLCDLAAHPLLAGIEEGAYVYFVHSYAPEGVPREERLATCTHGRTFAAICGRGRVMGTQFHPEKSGANGLRLLRNYIGMVGAIDSGGRAAQDDRSSDGRTEHESAPVGAVAERPSGTVRGGGRTPEGMR